MSEQRLSFTSEGRKLVGEVRRPEGLRPGERRPAFIVLHGFGSNRNAGNVLKPCAMLDKLGYATLRFDMPGCGESEGESGRMDSEHWMFYRLFLQGIALVALIATFFVSA